MLVGLRFAEVSRERDSRRQTHTISRRKPIAERESYIFRRFPVLSATPHEFFLPAFPTNQLASYRRSCRRSTRRITIITKKSNLIEQTRSAPTVGYQLKATRKSPASRVVVSRAVTTTTTTTADDQRRNKPLWDV